jgi:dUTP pyrophosphatase
MRTLLISTNNQVLKEKYVKHIESHNQQVTSSHPNAGFDLFNPQFISSYQKVLKIDTEIVASMIDENDKNCCFYLYPRSSIYKTNLRLANSVGIIDSGYRGSIMGMFDKDSDCSVVEQYSRLLQICSGDLKPFMVEMCDSIEELGLSNRGIGGFGSTGI